MRAILLCAVIMLGVVGCESDAKIHQLFYGTTPPSVVSITIGDVESVKSTGKGGLPSPSMVSPNQLAIVKMVNILKGQGVGEKIGLAYDAGRSNEPVAKQRYVFLWDQSGECIRYFTVKGNLYVKDGREIPLAELKKQ